MTEIVSDRGSPGAAPNFEATDVITGTTRMVPDDLNHADFLSKFPFFFIFWQMNAASVLLLQLLLVGSRTAGTVAHLLAWFGLVLLGFAYLLQ